MPTSLIITKVLEAVNGGNTQAFLDLFATNGEVNDWGSVYRGRREIEAWSDRELIGVNARFFLRSSEESGDDASMQVDVGGDGFTGPSRFLLHLENGLIREMRITG